MNNLPYPHSTHTFMCPLRWDYLPPDYNPNKGKESLSFDDRTDLGKILVFLKGTPWQRSFYRINNDPLQYNELTYFHAYATRTIFDLQQPDEENEWIVNRDKTMLYLEIEPVPGDYYRIETVSDGNFELQLAGLGLHVYTTGVAILSISVDNYNYPESEDVLRINEFGRRIYPQFLGGTVPYTGISRQKVLADSITLHCGKVKNGQPLKEDFHQYDMLHGKETHSVEDATGTYLYKQIIDFPKHICGLFSDDFVFGAAGERGGHKIRFNILTDDRMFFQSWYGNNEMATALSNPVLQTKTTKYTTKLGHIRTLQTKEVTDAYRYSTSPFWYAYQYGDTNPKYPSINNPPLMQQALLANTYSRWAGYGTLYGFTRDSFVIVSSSLATLIENGVPDIRQHQKTMYYQMAVLCLAQRAGILRFAAEVAALAKLGKLAGSQPETLQWIQQLYLNYIEFSNSVCYKEITPQIQGIEIYQQFRQAMDVPEQVKSLDEQIKELHDYAMLVEQKRAADKGESQAIEAHKLTKLAAVFLPPTFLASFFALFASDLQFTTSWNWPRIFAVIILIVLTIFPLFLYKHVGSFLDKYFSDKKDK